MILHWLDNTEKVDWRVSLVKARILSPPHPGITILRGHIGDRMSNKTISDIRAGRRGSFPLAMVGFQHSLYYLTHTASQYWAICIYIWIFSCLFTYASDSPGELIKMKVPGLYVRYCFSRSKVESRNLAHENIYLVFE